MPGAASVRPLVVLRASLCQLCHTGYNGKGQVGNGITVSPVTTPMAVVGSVTSWSAISAGGFHTCGLAATDGSAYCWGEALGSALKRMPEHMGCIFFDSGLICWRAALGRAAYIILSTMPHRQQCERASRRRNDQRSSDDAHGCVWKRYKLGGDLSRRLSYFRVGYGTTHNLVTIWRPMLLLPGLGFYVFHSTGNLPTTLHQQAVCSGHAAVSELIIDC